MVLSQIYRFAKKILLNLDNFIKSAKFKYLYHRTIQLLSSLTFNELNLSQFLMCTSTVVPYDL